jgi:hypothetical protein
MSLLTRVTNFLATDTAPRTGGNDGHDGPSSSRSHAERRAALSALHAALETEATAELAELQRRIGAVGERRRVEHAAADAREHARVHALSAELLRDAHAALEPLVGQWRTAPSRLLAAALGEELVTLMAREADECPAGSGSSRVLLALSHAFALAAAATRPGALVVFGTQPFAVEAAGAVAHALSSPAALFVALEGLEAEIDRITRDNASHEVDERIAARWAIVRTQNADALEAFDHAVQQAAAARFAATYEPPPATHHGAALY